MERAPVLGDARLRQLLVSLWPQVTANRQLLSVTSRVDDTNLQAKLLLAYESCLGSGCGPGPESECGPALSFGFVLVP